MIPIMKESSKRRTFLLHMYFICVEGLFTPKVSVNAGVDVHVDAWKEYIDFN